MTINEVFQKPTVKQVIFQIRFPNLFYMDKKIGDYQIKIMDKFPKSKLIQKKMVTLADVNNEMEPAFDNNEPNATELIWNFQSENNVELNVTRNSISLFSFFHKTYNNQSLDPDYRFRTLIEFAIENFLGLVSFPKINRIGLRYIDECPLFELDKDILETDKFKNHYNTTFPLSRFPLSDSLVTEFRTTLIKNDLKLNFRERFCYNENKPNFTLDFDAFKEQIETNQYLAITDSLHELIIAEYENHLKEPVFNHMRGKNDE